MYGNNNNQNSYYGSYNNLNGGGYYNGYPAAAAAAAAAGPTFENENNDPLYAVFTNGLQAFTYVAPTAGEPVDNFNRDEVKDVFYDAVLQQRFSKHLHILGLKKKVIIEEKKPEQVQPVRKIDPQPAPETEIIQVVLPPAPITVSELKISGVPEVGNLLTVYGWYLEVDAVNCKFEWLSNGVIQPGCNTASYKLQENDYGHVVICRCHYAGQIASVGIQTAEARVVIADHAVLELISVEAKGGPTHLDPVKVTATYSDGKYHPGICQWRRNEGIHGEFNPLKGHTDEIYYPTCDDLTGNLCLDYTPLEGKQKDVKTTVIVNPQDLTLNPEVARAVEGYVKAGFAEFKVTNMEGKDKVIRVDKKYVKLIDPSNSKATLSTHHSTSVVVQLYNKEINIFRLSLGPKCGDPVNLKCKDRMERDVIAMTVRSFIGTTVFNVEAGKGKKLHSVQSLSDLKHLQK